MPQIAVGEGGVWLLGYPTASLERSRNGLALAQDLAHPGSIANALPIAGLVHQLVGDVGAVRDVAEAMIALSTQHGFRQWLSFGRILDAWVQSEEGGGEAAITELRRHIDEYRAMGNDLWVPCFLSLLASTHLKRGAIEEGLGAVADALGTSDVTESRLWDPEFQRLTFCLLGVAAPADLISDQRTSPFNIGRRIELRDFTEAEAAPVAAPGQARGCRRAPWRRPRLVHRGLRHGRSEGGEAPAGEAVRAGAREHGQ